MIAALRSTVAAGAASLRGSRWDMTGKVVVITGAGGGIGRALAEEAARRGARLAISDIDEPGLAETGRLARAAGADEVRTDRVDVTEQAHVAEWAHRVLEQFGEVHLVINNAGMTHIGSVLDSSYKDMEKIMDVDYWGVVHGTKEFLPALIASGDGHIANLSSLFALMSVPKQNSYCSAKRAVQGFTESLGMEMDAAGHPVTVTSVHPGGIKTAVARSATWAEGTDGSESVKGFDTLLARHSPEMAAKAILDGVEKGRRRLLIGSEAHFMDLVTRVAPMRYQSAVTKFSSRFGIS